MSRCEFLSWYGAGNEPPVIGVAQELAARGHEVDFTGYAGQRPRFTDLGFGFRVLERADAAYAAASAPPGDVMPALVDAVWACPEHLDDVADVLAVASADVLVVDCMLFGALAALEGSGVPVAVLVHSAPGALFPPGGGGEQLVLQRLNRVRMAAGRPAIARLWDAWAPFPTLCMSVAELDPLAARVPPSFRFVGPVSERVAPSGWRPPWPADDPRPLVMASFSTGHAWDQDSRIRRTLDALAGDRYRLLVLSGVADVAGMQIPADAVVLPYVPHAEVLPHVAVTVTHAGHGTVAASLAYGVPLVSLPNPAADQPALAARVAELGAGIALDGETATAADVAEAVEVVLADVSYTAAARRLAMTIAASPGAQNCADVIEHLIHGVPNRAR